jgi:acetyltransferase-like isoleucine patch superfamily enzyme
MEGHPTYSSHGTGLDFRDRLGALGKGAVIEDGVRIFHPENVRIGAGAYIGHGAHIDGYHSGSVSIGDGSWIGAMAFLHGAGGLVIGRDVGIGPRVTILTSEHEAGDPEAPVLLQPLAFATVEIGDGADIGACAIILPGAAIGRGAIIGAGAVVSGAIPARAVAAGVPARVIRIR